MLTHYITNETVKVVAVDESVKHGRTALRVTLIGGSNESSVGARDLAIAYLQSNGYTRGGYVRTGRGKSSWWMVNEYGCARMVRELLVFKAEAA